MLKVTILGCGSSTGVPDLTIGWGDCDKTNPKNYRTRSSILIQTEQTNLLVDTSPDLRTQLINAGVNKIDAVFYTHMHADHTHGINELRCIFGLSGATIPVYGSCETMADITKNFDYLFDNNSADYSMYPPCLVANEIVQGSLSIGDIALQTFELDHGLCKTSAIKIGNFAYTVDFQDLSEENIQSLKGVEVWVVESLRPDQHFTHAGLEQVLKWTEIIQPKQVILTHMGVKMDYDSLIKRLPKNIVPAYDGLILEIS